MLKKFFNRLVDTKREEYQIIIQEYDEQGHVREFIEKEERVEIHFPPRKKRRDK